MKQLKKGSMRISMNGILVLLMTLSGCHSEDAPECLQAPGKIVQQEVPVEAFSKIVVYGKVKLFIEQGPDQQVTVEAGENLISQVSVQVKEGELSLRDLNTCDFFRTTYVPVVHVKVPDLTYIENAGNQMIEGVGKLHFSNITLRSNNLSRNPEIFTNGDFKFDLNSQRINVSGDDFSNFYLTGSTSYLLAQFWAGDGRLEARELVTDSIRIFHRGTNKMILNPQQALKGEIRSTGDVISVHRPPVVEVKSFYTGRLIFE